MKYQTGLFSLCGPWGPAITLNTTGWRLKELLQPKLLRKLYSQIFKISTVSNVAPYRTYISNVIRRSPRRGFPDHTFMLHCTFFPHLLAQRGVPSRTTGEGAVFNVTFPSKNYWQFSSAILIQFSCNSHAIIDEIFRNAPAILTYNSHLQFSPAILIQFSPTILIQFSPDNSHPIFTWQFSSNSHLQFSLNSHQHCSVNSHQQCSANFS